MFFFTRRCCPAVIDLIRALSLRALMPPLKTSRYHHVLGVGVSGWVPLVGTFWSGRH